MAMPRPTWKLGDEIHSGSRAAKDIDLTVSTAEALAEEKYYSRMNEVTDVKTAAMTYAASCMSGVLVPLAILARERGHITEPDGWEFRVESVSVILSRPILTAIWPSAPSTFSSSYAPMRYAFPKAGSAGTVAPGANPIQRI